MSTESDFGHLMGWLNRPAAVANVVAGLRFSRFADAAPDLKDTGKLVDVFYWEYETPAIIGPTLADLLKAWYLIAQGIGDCVSMGWGTGCQDSLTLQILMGWLQAVDALVATEPIYGGSRCEVGGWWNDYNDGSIGAYAAKWVSEKGGVILRKNYGTIDLTEYSPERAKQYGAKGCPDALEPDARLHPVTAVTPCRTYEEVRDAICNLHPVAVASNIGYTMKRSPGGWCQRSGSWNHQMAYRGHGIAKGNKPFIAQKNSWGDYLGSDNNVVTLESGREVTLPPGHFLITPEDCTAQAKQGDTFALAGTKGWVQGTIPYI